MWRPTPSAMPSHPGAGAIFASMKDGEPRSYRRHPEHERALLFEPDVVVCNLGINDIMDWDVRGVDFERDYAALLEDYSGLRTKPQIVLWTPLAPLFPGHAYHESPHVAEIEAAIARVADHVGAATLAMRGPLAAHPEWFPDFIHPDANGAAAIARTVADVVRSDR